MLTKQKLLILVTSAFTFGGASSQEPQVSSKNTNIPVGRAQKMAEWKAETRPGRLVIFANAHLGFTTRKAKTWMWNDLQYDRTPLSVISWPYKGQGSYQKLQFWSLSLSGQSLLAPLPNDAMGLWNVQGLSLSLPIRRSISVAAFAPQNRVVVLSSFQAPVFYDLKSRTVKVSGLKKGSFYQAATFSSNGKIMAEWSAIEGDSAVTLYDMQSGKSKQTETGREMVSSNFHNSVPEPLFLSSASKVVFASNTAYAYRDDLSLSRTPLKVFDRDKERIIYMDKAGRFLSLDFINKVFKLRSGRDFHVVWQSSVIKVGLPRWDTPEDATVTAVSHDGHDVAIAQNAVIRVWRLDWK